MVPIQYVVICDNSYKSQFPRQDKTIKIKDTFLNWATNPNRYYYVNIYRYSIPNAGEHLNIQEILYEEVSPWILS